MGKARAAAWREKKANFVPQGYRYTPAQDRVAAFVADWPKVYGSVPTLAHIAAHMGFANVESARNCLAKCVRNGSVKRSTELEILAASRAASERSDRAL